MSLPNNTYLIVLDFTSSLGLFLLNKRTSCYVTLICFLYVYSFFFYISIYPSSFYFVLLSHVLLSYPSVKIHP